LIAKMIQSQTRIVERFLKLGGIRTPAGPSVPQRASKNDVLKSKVNSNMLNEKTILKVTEWQIKKKYA